MNKYLYKLFIWLLCFGWVAVACDDDDNEPSCQYVTETGSSQFVLKGYGHELFTYGDNVLQPLGLTAPIYIENTVLTGRAYGFAAVPGNRLDGVTDAPADGYEASAPIVEDAVYVARYTDLRRSVYLKLRIVRIEGSEVTVEYALLKEEILPNGNANGAEGADETVTRLEMPHRDLSNTYVAHFVSTDEGEEVLNLAIEWNASMNHAEWVAFAFDNVTGWDNGVGRTDAWGPDTSLPAEMQVTNADHTNDGFDRGHLCASEDRQWSADANEQTFYFSNMSPQLNAFNGGIWWKMEQRVQSWGYSVSTGGFDYVYVTKGGTLNNLLTNFTSTKKASDGTYPTTDANGLTSKGLACPKYYFMAVLAQKGAAYQAIAFLIEHREDWDSSTDLKQFVVTIDALEEATGLDFFCNLPNALEDAVEASVDETAWNWN